MASILRVDELNVWYPIRRGIFNRRVGEVRAVNGVSLEIGSGETLGLVGESGCGKSTLGRAIVGLEAATSGHIYFEGKELFAERSSSIRRQCQMVFQDPYSSLNPRMTILDILTEGMLYHRVIAPSQKVDAAKALLSEVGLDADCLNRYPHEFSGGQRQRISIARAISLEPKFIVCDEPVSALDVSVQAQVINLLMDLREKRGLSYLFISHDIRVVQWISQKIAVMYLGRLVETGSTQEVLTHPKHPYTQALLSAVPRPGSSPGKRIILKGEQPSPVSPPTGCSFHPRCPYATEECKTKVPPLKGTGHQWTCWMK